MNKQLYYDDIDSFVNEFIFKEEVRNTSFLVTGGTGLIGGFILNSLSGLNEKFGLNIKIYGLARNKDKVISKGLSENITWIYGSMENITSYDFDVDYVIHTASPTQSAYLLNNPVETIESNILGTMNLINYSKRSNAKLIYLSSIEIYGEVFDDSITLKEDMYGVLNHLKPRSAYPESKKLIECLLTSYGIEYNLNFNIIRLTQTFGAGIDENDNRVFAYIAKSIINGENIILKTNGQSSKPYIYVSDAVNAIFYIIFRGKSKETYNVANPKTYISIYDMAKKIIDEFNKNISIKIEMNNDSSMYAPVTKTKLDVSKLEDLGFEPKYNLVEMYSRLINYLKN